MTIITCIYIPLLSMSLSSLFRLQKVNPKYWVSLTNLNGSAPIVTEVQNNLKHFGLYTIQTDFKGLNKISFAVP